MSWESTSYAGDNVDLSYGFQASATPTTDIASLPRSIWGKAAVSDLAGRGWDFAAKAEVRGTDFSNPNLELDAGNEDYDVNLHMVANAGRKNYFQLRSIEATKGFDVAATGAHITITPRYKVLAAKNEDDDHDKDDDDDDDYKDYNHSSDIVLNYAGDRTNVKLTASLDNTQQLTISQQINNDNRIAPTITSDGDISLEWERRLSADSSVTANLRPNQALNIKWKDAAWTAVVNMPIVDGTNIHGANVHIQRDVKF